MRLVFKRIREYPLDTFDVQIAHVSKNTTLDLLTAHNFVMHAISMGCARMFSASFVVSPLRDINHSSALFIYSSHCILFMYVCVTNKAKGLVQEMENFFPENEIKFLNNTIFNFR